MIYKTILPSHTQRHSLLILATISISTRGSVGDHTNSGSLESKVRRVRPLAGIQVFQCEYWHTILRSSLVQNTMHSDWSAQKPLQKLNFDTAICTLLTNTHYLCASSWQFTLCIRDSQPLITHAQIIWKYNIWGVCILTEARVFRQQFVFHKDSHSPHVLKFLEITSECKIQCWYSYSAVHSLTFCTVRNTQSVHCILHSLVISRNFEHFWRVQILIVRHKDALQIFDSHLPRKFW